MEFKNDLKENLLDKDSPQQNNQIPSSLNKYKNTPNLNNSLLVLSVLKFLKKGCWSIKRLHQLPKKKPKKTTKFRIKRPKSSPK